jgi:hypothetical protein
LKIENLKSFYELTIINNKTADIENVKMLSNSKESLNISASIHRKNLSRTNDRY